MDIKQQNQYNQGISRYKLLSGNAGVGAIITSNIGNYILISDVNKWDFIRAANHRIKDIMNDSSKGVEQWYKEAKKEIVNNLGVELVDDERFIELLKKDKALKNLLCLAAIPHLSLNDNFNSINTKDNPVIKRLKERGIDKEAKDFTVPGTHFPKWFRNDKGLLKTYDAWKAEWKKSGTPLLGFAPPRDINTPYGNNRKVWLGLNNTIDEFKELTQLNLILICENGHLSDIPWSDYLRWRTELRSDKTDTKGTNLLMQEKLCCTNPKLKWSESTNRSEGYASIYIECLNCHMGSGDADKPDKPKINLQGINNLQPQCAGHKPWEISLDEDKSDLPFDSNCCDKSGKRSTMHIALVTGNNIYFANTFSSVYIPMELVKGISEEMDRILKICDARYTAVSDPNKTKQAWADKRIDSDLLDENSINVQDKTTFILSLKELFINGQKNKFFEDSGDLHEIYREQEYKVFTTHDHCEKEGLFFSNMTVPQKLQPYFKKIKKVEELKVTAIQLDFTRINPNEKVIGPDGSLITIPGKDTFSIASQDVHILPAIENFGEGIFFEFDEDAIANWMSINSDRLKQRIEPLMPTKGAISGNSIRQRVKRDQSKFLLIHTFSHLIMRALEFTCGYPTASLKERLYISPKMSGVLIYTAEGSEGSMGGLVWQAHPEKIQSLVDIALKNALDCSSDPLCWESEGQGVFNLNLSACFSCGLVSETACEERNIVLDRRVLIDPEFGFLKDMNNNG